MAKTKVKVKKISPVQQEAKQAAASTREIKKEFALKLAALKNEFDANVKMVVTRAHQKAAAEFEKHLSKHTEVKAKLLRDTAAKLDKDFHSKFATSLPKGQKITKQVSKKSSRKTTKK